MSEASDSELFERLPVGAYRSSPDGLMLRVNAAMLAMYGYADVEEMRAVTHDFTRNPYVDPERRLEFWDQLASAGEVRNFESLMWNFKTGAQMWLREHAHAVRGKDGAIQYIEGTVEDITEERLAKERLHRNQALLHNMLQTIPDPLWVKDPNGVYLTCNDYYAQVMGASRAAIIGTNDEHWYGAELARLFQETDQMVMRVGKPISFEERFISPMNPQGALHEITKTPMFDDAGRATGVLAIARNIQARKEAERLLRDTTEQLELAMISADLGRWSHDLANDKGYAMDLRACQMLGRADDEADKGRHWGYLIHPDDVAATLAAMRAHLNGAAPAFEAEYRARHMDGRWIWIASRGKVVQFAQDGRPLTMVGTLMDISARKRGELQLRAIQAELQATLNALPDLLFELDRNGRYIAAHSHAELGEEDTDYLIGKTIAEVLPQDATQVCMDAIQEAMLTGRSRGRQYSLQLPRGKRWYELSVARKPTAAGEDERFIAIARDVTEGKEAAEAIRHLAFHDSLTGLPNRRMLTDRLQRALATAKRHDQAGALLFLDLDRFKELNDTQGHDVGDLLLMEVGKRLVQSVRAIDTVARLGGDEFVVLIEELGADTEAARMHAQIVGMKILASLNEPYELGQVRHVSTPSIGAALFGKSTASHQDVLKEADIAMYQVKAAGRNMFKFYDPDAVDTLAGTLS